jgi:hypothetical protein
MGLGGPFLFISSMHLSNAFPRNSGKVLSILTGSFDASSCIFLIYRSIYYNNFPVSLTTFFLAYLFFPVSSIIVQIWFMPKDTYQSELEISAERQASSSNEQSDESAGLLGNPHPSHYSCAGAVEGEIVETYGSGRRASAFTIPKDRRGSYEAAEHDRLRRNPVVGAMYGKTPFEQIKSPYWMYIPVFFINPD